MDVNDRQPRIAAIMSSCDLDLNVWPITGAISYTSYADTAGTQIVNQVENIYNGLGQLAFQYQAVSGVVDVGSTPYVQYDYTSPSNGSRLASMVYPNGRTIDYNYSGTNLNSALDNAIGRLDSISDGANSGDAGQVLEQYSYLGLSTIVARNHPQTNINLTYLGSAGSIGSGGDQYIGLDRFGRVVNQNWVNASTGQSTDNFTYSYDANANVTSENNLLDAAYSQTFTYDPLNRLGSSTLGGAAYQSWTLDSQGNWNSHTIYGNTQTQTANAQNQTTSVSGGTAPTYDGNGNAVSMELTIQGAGGDATLVYDAWNRLVAVKDYAGQIVAQYTYNAMGYRVTESYPLGGPGTAAGTTNYLYYDANWQQIEIRTNGTATNNVTSQIVWSAAYIDAAILQDPWGGGYTVLEGRKYFLQDANWNTVAVIMPNLGPGPAWFVEQRYVYSPYGNTTILNADWSATPSGETLAVNNLYQGMTLDPVTGLYYARNRNYSPSLGRWINQDPAGYINGANTYQFVMSNPVNAVDPWGLQMHHIIPQSLYDLDNDTRIPFSQAAVRVFKEATLDAPYHVNFTKQHFAYNNSVRAAIEKYLADHGICPTEMTTQEAKNLVKAIRSSNNKIIKWFLKGITTTPSFLDKLGDFLKRLTEGTENVPMFIFLPVGILRDFVPQPIDAGPPPPTA